MNIPPDYRPLPTDPWYVIEDKEYFGEDGKPTRVFCVINRNIEDAEFTICGWKAESYALQLAYMLNLLSALQGSVVEEAK